jgi:hypothetical protein
MIRREAYKASKKYQPSMKYGYEDWEFSVGIAGKGWRPSLVPLPLFNHRRHGRTMTAEAHEKKQYLFNELIRLNARTYTVDRIAELKKQSRLLISMIIPFTIRHHLLMRPWLQSSARRPTITRSFWWMTALTIRMPSASWRRSKPKDSSGSFGLSTAARPPRATEVHWRPAANSSSSWMRMT